MPRKMLASTIVALLLVLCAGLALAGGIDLIKAGNKAAQAGKFEKAVQLFTQALRAGDLSPQNQAVALNNRGSAKDDLGQTDWAILDFNQALKLNPKYAEAYYNRSFAFERKGQVAKALQDMQKAVSLSPGDKDYRDRAGYLKGKMIKSGAK